VRPMMVFVPIGAEICQPIYMSIVRADVLSD
jgi:hypothetical protein